MSTYTSPDNKTAGLHRRLLWPVVILAGILALGYAQEAQPLPVQPPQPPTPPEELLDLYEDAMELEASEQVEEAQRRVEEARRQREVMQQLTKDAQRQLDEAVRSGRRIQGILPQDQVTQQAYQDAYGHILDEKWAQARQAFEEFLERYGEQRGNRYVDDARFWICFAMEKSRLPDEEVFEAYHQFIQEFTNSNWLDDAKANLIKIGRRLSEVNRKNAAQYGPIIGQLEKDYEFEVALATIDQLRNVSSDKALNAIFGLYDRAENDDLRQRIIYALGRFDDPEAVARLGDIARKDPNPDIRRAAVEAISRNRSDAAFNILMTIIKGEENAEVRQRAIQSLWRSESKEVVSLLLDVARNDPHIKVRTAAVSTLSRIDTPEAQAALISILEGK